uniref:Uncharacterized protein n=1 Tax=Rhizophora mucronata TaxID=61149 RepID=A0A2P2PHH5_RHIMU
MPKRPKEAATKYVQSTNL